MFLPIILDYLRIYFIFFILIILLLIRISSKTTYFLDKCSFCSNNNQTKEKGTDRDIGSCATDSYLPLNLRKKEKAGTSPADTSVPYSLSSVP